MRYAASHMPGIVTPGEASNLEREALVKALREAHRALAHDMMRGESLTAVERAHMRELTPVVAAAGREPKA